MKSKKFTFTIVAIIAILSNIILAQAWETGGTWEYDSDWESFSVKMRMSKKGFPEDSFAYDACKDAIGRFNHNPSKFNWDLYQNDTDVSHGNGQNEVWFSSDIDAPAYCKTYFKEDGSISETDIVYKSDYQYGWTGSHLKTVLIGFYNPSENTNEDRSIQTTAMHELGHAAGFKHQNHEYNIMGSDMTFMYSYGTNAYAYLGADLTYGLRQVYGNIEDDHNDLSLSPFKYSHASGEYSAHKLCEVYYPDTTTAVSVNGYAHGQKRYVVERGEKYGFEYTIENNGKQWFEDCTISFYLSGDTSIETSDTYLGKVTVSNIMNTGIPYTRITKVEIPSNTILNKTLYVGVFIDGDERYSEVRETNNFMYHPIIVQ